MILSRHFYDLLDCLAGQFFKTQSARCVKNDFGINISSNAKKYFSVAIIPESLPGKLAVRGVLTDDSVQDAKRNGITFTIYIDPSKIDGEPFEVFSIIILAHEICHFAFYYELFIKSGDDINKIVHTTFKNTLLGKFEVTVSQEQEEPGHTYLEAHEIDDLLKNFKKFPESHFTNGLKTKIDYRKFLDDFVKHLDYGKKLDAYRKRKT